MNLAGNQAKNLFKSIRTGNPPSIVGMWAAATVVDQIRKRKRPDKELLLRKKLKPGESYVIRVPGEGESSLAEQVPSDTVVAEVADSEESIGTQLLSAATGLLSAAAEAEPTVDRATPEPTSRRQARQERKAAAGDPGRTSRRQARKDRKAAAAAEEAVEAGPSTVVSTLVDIAASFSEAEDAQAQAAAEPVPKTSRRKRRRQARIAGLQEADLDRDALPRRRSRKLRRSERKAERRPSRRRTRKAHKQQKKATKVLGRIAKKQSKMRRSERRLAKAERVVEQRQTRVEKRSTRRRRRKLKKAEKALSKRQG